MTTAVSILFGIACLMLVVEAVVYASRRACMLERRRAVAVCRQSASAARVEATKEDDRAKRELIEALVRGCDECAREIENGVSEWT